MRIHSKFSQVSKKISIQQARQIANISDSTVRRWLKSLTEKEQSLHIYKQGRKILIDYSFFIQSFEVEQQKDKQVQNTGGVNVQQIINNQANQIEKLLEENRQKDTDLKNSFTLILSLRDRIENLTGELKRLETSKEGGTSERLTNIYTGALVVTLVAIVLYVILIGF